VPGASPIKTTTMDKPPDISRTSIYNKHLGEPKYIVITRTDNKSFENVSPFLIKKTIDFACGGEVESCKNTRSGYLLVKTKNNLQANKLLRIKNMADIEVKATEHKTLNFSKGVIYCNELRSIDETEILNELKHQKVTEVRKILKKQDQALTETGLIIITFQTLTLPDSLNIGYEKIRVRPYIPLPLRCRKCLRFGHPTPTCKSPDELCKNCSEKVHTEENEKCNSEKCCINCKHMFETDAKHSPLDRSCPTFIKQKELITIKTTQKVDHKTALELYYTRRNQHLSNSFASVLSKQQTPKTTTTTKITPTPQHTKQNNDTQATHEHQQRKLTSYQDLSTDTSTPTQFTNTTPPPQTSPAHQTTDVISMDLDPPTTSKDNMASERTQDLKLRIFSKDKNKTLTTNLKATKTNQPKNLNKNKHINISDSESM